MSGSLVNELFEPRHRKAKDNRRERVITLATGLTVGRAILTSGGFVVAIASNSHEWLLITLGVSMMLDLLDGLAARTLQWETVTGAQLDSLADRVAALFVAIGVVSLHGDAVTVAVVAVVWLQYGVVDQLMSNYFLRFGLWSPDHFHVIDKQIWAYNWSPRAKLASTAPIALLAIGAWCVWPALAISLVLIAIRLRMYPKLKALAEYRIPELHLAYYEAPCGDTQTSESMPSQVVAGRDRTHPTAAPVGVHR
jgi:phosphatidylglycerophosphate synthase